MVFTRSKRAKRILRCLSLAQHEDHLLSSSTTPLIRYNLLHNYHRCIQVSVDLGLPPYRTPLTMPFDAMPNFLKSQLEAQKIANGTRLWSQVVPILTFIQSNIRLRLDRSRGFPTLFVWHSRENHRSYFFFAFVEIKMVSRTYSVRELLRLRSSTVTASKEFLDRLHAKLQQDASFSMSPSHNPSQGGMKADWAQGDISRMPSDRSLPLIMEEDIDAPGDSENDPDKDPITKSNAAPQLDGTDYEWKYRGREGSNDDTTHPICSPAGVTAQKDEGFQRFYKSVVSPTHVRVTAGGRIVPNTRGTASPTVRVARDRINGDNRPCNRPVSSGHQENGPYPVAQIPYGAYPHMIPGFAPGMAPAMTPGMAPGMAPAMGPGMAPAMAPGMAHAMAPGMMGHPAYPVISWSMGHHFGMMPQPHMAQMVGPALSANNSTSHSDAGATENPTPVRASPPEQFDRNRPFIYNGQWVTPHGTMYPHGTMPHPPGFPIAVAAPQVMASRFNVNPWVNSQATRMETLINPHAPPSTAPSFAGSANPPASSILESEITRKQLSHLRQHLKSAEDQLLYNKHQIDEKAMEHQIDTLRFHIKLFEDNLEKALVKEESHRPKADNGKEAGSCRSSREGHDSKSSSASDARPGNDQCSLSTSQEEAHQARASNKRKDSMTSPLPSGSSAAQPAPLKSALKKPSPTETIKKASSLPVTAALAPPFQPRTDGSLMATVTDSSTISGGLPLFMDSHRTVGMSGFASRPYLIGKLPAGCDPALATDADYVYERELTEDELRARHLFWGNTPHHLQKGLPKFDGKDFYPPSPTRDGSLMSGTRPRLPSENSQTGYVLSKAKADSDPFGSFGRLSVRPARNSLTQSEQLPSTQSPMSSSPVSTNLSPIKRNSQVGCGYEDFRKAIGDACQSPTYKEKSSPESGDDSGILFKGRRNTPTTRFVSPPLQTHILANWLTI